MLHGTGKAEQHRADNDMDEVADDQLTQGKAGLKAEKQEPSDGFHKSKYFTLGVFYKLA